MAIPPLGTFDYQGVVGAVAADGAFECDLVQRPAASGDWMAQVSGAPSAVAAPARGWAQR